MKCDGCGRAFDVRNAQCDSRNEPIGPGSRRPYTRLVSLTLCPACAASRRNTLWFVLLALIVFFVAGAMLALVVK